MSKSEGHQTDREDETVRTRILQAGLITAAVLVALTGCTTGAEPKPHPPHPALSSAHPAAVDGFFGADLTRQDFGSFGMNRTEIIQTGDRRFPSGLRVRYPADSASQLAAAGSGTEHGGAQLYLARRDGPVDEAYLRYFVRFPQGFDFVKGGKLPGLYGGRINNGRKIPDGTNGFSTRYMWRTAGAGEMYAYLPTSVTHGTSLGRGDWTWPTGAWTAVEQHVRLNTPGKSDGQVQVRLNGSPVFEQTGLTFRTTSSLRIDGLFFSTFFGGGDASWATPRDQYADFAGFALTPSWSESAAATG